MRLSARKRSRVSVDPRFLIGFVGLNNIKANDYMNAVVQALGHARDLRNFMLLEKLEGKSELGGLELFYVIMPVAETDPIF